MRGGNLTREHLIRVSAELFSEKGFRAATMEDIAQALGIRKGSIYYYIKPKEELLREIISTVTHRESHSQK